MTASANAFPAAAGQKTLEDQLADDEWRLPKHVLLCCLPLATDPGGPSISVIVFWSFMLML